MSEQPRPRSRSPRSRAALLRDLYTHGHIFIDILVALARNQPPRVPTTPPDTSVSVHQPVRHALGSARRTNPDVFWQSAALQRFVVHSCGWSGHMVCCVLSMDGELLWLPSRLTVVQLHLAQLLQLELTRQARP